MADTTRDIELRMRVNTLENAKFRDVIASVDQLTAALSKQIGVSGKLEVSERELKSTLTQFNDAAKNISGLTALIDRAKLLSEQVKLNQQDLDKAADALKRHRDAMEAGTATGKAAEASLSGFEKRLQATQSTLARNSATLAEYNSRLNAAGISERNLLEVEQQLVVTATQIGAARTKSNQALLDQPRLEREAREAAKATAQANRDAAEAAKQKAAADIAAAKAALDARRAALGSGSTGFREFSQRIDREKELNNLLKQLNRDRATDETRQARAVVDAIRQAERDKTAARVQGAQFNPANPTAVPGQPRTDATGRVSRGAATPRGFLGLRPYEVTNLGYQANDVISGFASGQNPGQILAQQSGQIFQIFTTAATRYNDEMRAAGQATINFGAVALRWLPLVGAALAAVAVGIGAITHEMQTLASNREFTGVLTVNKYAADQNVEALTNLRKELRNLGVDWKDAGAAISAAVGASVRGDRIRELLVTAEAMSRFSGKPVAESVKLVTDALNGGSDAFDKLLEQFPVFDKAQAAQIRRWLDTNQTAKAQEGILRILASEMAKVRDQTMSPFEKETEKLRTTWNNFLDDLAKKGAFTVLNNSLVFLTQGLTNMITTAQAFFKMIDAIDTKFPWLKYVSLGPAGLAKGAVDAASAIAGKLGLGGGAPGAGPLNQTGPYPDYAKGTKFDPRGVKIDTPQLQTLAEAIAEASKSLPSGYRVEALSTERTPGSLTSNGTPSEHGYGRAFDVRIVDANNQPVPALMTTKQQVYDPIFQAFDKVLVDVLAKRGVTEVAIGGTFKNPVDAGHYSIGGHEAAATAGRVPIGQGVGVTSGATPTQDSTSEKIKRDLEIEIGLQRASSKEVEAKLILEQERIKLKNEGAAADKIEGLAQERLKLFLYDRLKAEQELKLNRSKSAESDKTTADTARAEKAGQDAVNKSIADGVTNYKDLEQVRDRGAADERARIAKERSDREAFNTLKKQFETDLRSIELKHQSDLEQALEAVNIKYKQRLEAIEKLKEGNKNTSQAEIDAQKEIVEQLKKREEAEARSTAAIKSAEQALNARGEAVRTINRLEELGEITLQQKEDMTKKTFENSRKSILDPADAIEKSLADPSIKRSATEIEELTNKVKLLRAEAKYVDPFWKGLKETFTNSFSTGLSTAFDTISQAIGGAIAKTQQWKDVWVSVRNAAANFFAGLLKDLATYILKAQAAKLASSLFGGTSFGDFLGLAKPAASAAGAAATTATTTAATTSTGLFGWGFLGLKEGGVAGRRTPTGMGDPSWWAGAPRYRSGTVVGLAPDEQRAILHMGEEVLSADNPRNILNGGGQRGAVNFRAVLVDDQRKMAEAMAGAHGEQVIVRHLHRNAATIRDIVRG